MNTLSVWNEDEISEMKDTPYKAQAEDGPRDYSDEVTLHRSPWVRYSLIGAGTIALGLGIVGIFLPILPTTPLILLAAACYANSSVRFYNWLMNNRWFGPLLHRWRKEGTVPLRAKIIAIAMIIVTVGTSVYFFIPVMAVKILVGLIGLGVIIYLWRLPTTPKNVEHE